MEKYSKMLLQYMVNLYYVQTRYADELDETASDADKPLLRFENTMQQCNCIFNVKFVYQR